MIIILFPFSFAVIITIIVQDTYLLFYDDDVSMNSLHDYIPIIHELHSTSRKRKVENLARHKSRNSETENVSRRTTVIMRHKSFVPQFFCRLNNGSPSFTVKLIVADYDIEYFVFAMIRYVFFREEAVSSVNRFTTKCRYMVANIYPS